MGFNFKKVKLITLILLYLYLAVSSILLIYYHKIGFDLRHNWILFYTWAFNFFLALGISLIQMKDQLYSICSRLKSIFYEDRFLLFFVMILALITRFIFLTNFPFISMGDELRDAGLNALRIKQGFTKDFFDLGSYQGYGNFIPLISYFFSFIFKTSILIYRFPAAIIGILSIFFTYLLSRIWAGKYTAIIASLLLIASVRHLHYSRTEWEIIMDSLLSLLLLLSAYITLRDWKVFFLLGLLSGFSLHFYAGIRSFIIILSVYLLCFYLGKSIYVLFKKKWQSFFLNIKLFMAGLFLLALGVTIGIGPTINKLDKFSQAGIAKPIIYDQDFQSKSFFDKINFLYSNYEKAFSLYVFERVDDFRFRYTSPMIDSPFNWFFLLGLALIVLGFNKKIAFSYLLFTLIMIFPFANQVFINQITMDHRIIGILPIINIVSAYGFVNFWNKIISQKHLKKVLMGVIVGIFLAFQLWIFFFQRPSDKIFAYKDYVFYEISQFIKRDKKYDSYYIMYDYLYDFYLLHYLEGFEFFAYPKKVEVIDRSQFINYITLGVKNAGFISPVYIPELDRQPTEYPVYCSKKIIPQYECPLNYEGKYSMFVYDKF